MKLIVTAGGQGTKLWPYSREDKPKQFQPIVGDKSLYTETIETLLKKFAPEDIFISTKRKFIKYISAHTVSLHHEEWFIREINAQLQKRQTFTRTAVLGYVWFNDVVL